MRDEGRMQSWMHPLRDRVIRFATLALATARGFASPRRRFALLRAGGYWIALGLFLSDPLAARERPLLDSLIDNWGGSVSMTSDYVYRGVSLSRGRAAIQGGLHAGVGSHLSGGVWVSTVENQRDEGTPLETSGFLAYAWQPKIDWSVRAAWTHYVYFGRPSQVTYDYDELAVSLAYQSRWVVGVAWMPNAEVFRYPEGRKQASAAAADFSWAQPVIGAWSATAGAGYYDVSDLYDTGYAYWHAGFTGSVGPCELDLLYIDSDHHATRIYGQSITGTRWSAALRWRF